MQSLLIKNVDLNGRRLDVRCELGVISSVAEHLHSEANERVLNAKGGTLLPSLRDDHVHLLAMAARRRSMQCGPPEISVASQLKYALQRAKGTGWIRGVGYHESVAGDLTASRIDQWVDDRPVRIQHRSGRLWYFNSRGAAEFGLPKDQDGQLYRQDEEIYERLPLADDLSDELGEVAREFASFGVTHVTDATPSNDEATLMFLQNSCPDLRIRGMGGSGLVEGHRKIILDDYRLPDFRVLCEQIAEAHRMHRAVAIHCVSKVEVVFAVAAIADAGTLEGDRLEHATELPPDVISNVDALGLKLVPNPNFLYDRGDQYIVDNESAVLDSLFPIRSILARGIQCTGSTDAPFGSADPWCAMKAATDRRTRNGATIASQEAIQPEEALGLFTDDREIEIGASANLVCLDRPWSDARNRLESSDVIATILEGRITYLRS
ncbi:MAG: amidohydrolase family protein [Gammaproteobacteria bacterium]|nr:amidohydrolase family protein [Gammaproteobacteria bacterium]